MKMPSKVISCVNASFLFSVWGYASKKNGWEPQVKTAFLTDDTLQVSRENRYASSLLELMRIKKQFYENAFNVISVELPNIERILNETHIRPVFGYEHTIIVNLWKDVRLACLCNNCRLFCQSQVMPNFSWHRFTARLLDVMFTNKIVRFTDYDRDRKIEFVSSIFTIQCITDLDKLNLVKLGYLMVVWDYT